MRSGFYQKVDDVYHEAIAVFGREAQIEKFVEECGEAIVAVQHYKVGRTDSLENFIEEVTDVAIMVEQMKIILGEGLCKEIEKRKLARLKEKMEMIKTERIKSLVTASK